MTRLAWIAVCLTAVLAGCGSDSKPPAGKPCQVNSDCNNPLSCTFGRCHVACNVTRDCPLGQRCVKATLGNVCQLAEEKVCSPATMCMAPLTCAIDLQCRNRCTADTDCTAGQKCTDSVCAETAELTDGKLKAVDAGAPSADAAVIADAASGADAAPGADTAPGVDAAVADAPPSGTLGPCGVPEAEPNEDKDRATPLGNNVTLPSCLGNATDKDFYELTAPNDPAGGYYQFAFTDVGDFEIDLLVYSVADNGMIDRIYTESYGQNLYAHLSAAPGQKYRLEVRAFSAGEKLPAKYTLKVTYTKLEDMYEPNDSADAMNLRALTLGMPITAYMFEGYRKARITDEDVQDWYTVMASPGILNVKLESVPSNLTALVRVLSPGGVMEQMIGLNNGADVTLMEMVETAGVYRIGVMPWSTPPDGFAKQDVAGTLPSNFTKPYKLTVSQ